MGADCAAVARQGGPSRPHGSRQRPIREWRAVGGTLGRAWHDSAERYGKWKSVHKRFSRWAKAGVRERVFQALIEDPRNQYLMLDTTLVRAHQQAATGKGDRTQALGRSQG